MQQPDTTTPTLERLKEALEPFAWIGQWFFARSDIPDDEPVVDVHTGFGSDFALTRGMFKAAHAALDALLATPPEPPSEPAGREGWQLIETAPRDGTPVLVGIAGYNPRSCWWDEKTGCWIIGAFWADDRRRVTYLGMAPTHWQPLPEPPPLSAPPSVPTDTTTGEGR